VVSKFVYLENGFYQQGALNIYGQTKDTEKFFSLLIDFRAAEGSGVTHIFLKDIKTMQIPAKEVSELSGEILYTDCNHEYVFAVLKN
jgi:hypothetical protein